MKIERYGFVQALNGEEAWINTLEDKMVKFVTKDRQEAKDFYCQHVKVTIEIIDANEIPELKS